MTDLLVTFPGRAGDLLWALPTVRAIAAHYGPVTLQICGEFESLLPILEGQPYLKKVIADHAWSMSHGWEAPSLCKPAVLETYHYDGIYHLGYRRWPELPLPLETWLQATELFGILPPIDLAEPWITGITPSTDWVTPLVIGWTECHFELKVGLMALLERRQPAEDYFEAFVLAPPGSRWITEAGFDPIPWLEAAQRIMAAQLFLGDCSALHVLAVAMGIPVLLMEPMEARWQGIFYPLGMDGPQITVVKGTDGKPTFDARHVGEALDRAREVSR